MKKTNNPAENPKDRRTAVMLEKIYSEFKTFGENLDFVKNRVESIWIQTGRNTEDITMMRIELSVVKKDVAVLKTDVATLKSEVSIMNGRLTHVEEDIKTIKVDIAGIKNDFGPRLTKLESIVK